MADDLTLATGNATGLPVDTRIWTNFRDHNGTNAEVQGVEVVGTDDVTLLASAAHATGSAVNSADQTNYIHKGALFFLNVTVEAGSGKTLSLKIQGKDPISGNYIDIYSFGVLVTHATGTFGALVHPGIIAADIGSGIIAAKVGILPKVWRAAVTASDATSWTYSLSASMLAA